MVQQKLSEKLVQVNNINMGLEHSLFFLFQLIAHLNPDSNCCNSFKLSWVDKVATGTQSLVPIIANVVFRFAAALDTIHFVDHVRMNLISQLINCISKELHKHYLNISIEPLFQHFLYEFLVLSLLLVLHLNEILSLGKSARGLALVNAGLP